MKEKGYITGGDLEKLSVKSTATNDVQDIIMYPYINLTFGTAKLYECIKAAKDDMYEGLNGYCGEYDSVKEDFFLRDVLADIVGETMFYPDAVDDEYNIEISENSYSNIGSYGDPSEDYQKKYPRVGIYIVEKYEEGKKPRKVKEDEYKAWTEKQ